MEEESDKVVEKSPNFKLLVSRVAFLPAQKGLPVASIITGVLAALRKLKISVGILKVGGSLSQLTHYRRLTGKLAFSLHPGLVSSAAELIPSLVRASGGAEIVLIEGEEGIRDVFPSDYGVLNSQELAFALKTPTILVIDGEGYRQSISSLVKGFVEQEQFRGISGVIVVNVESEREIQIKSLENFEKESGVRLVGVIPKSDSPIVDFHPEIEQGSAVSRTRLINSLEQVQSYLNLDVVREIASTATQIEVARTSVATKSRISRIAVADDTAMNETFQENLDLLRRKGADLVAFSPQSDEKLPSHVRAVYLPGGRTEKYLESLSGNTAMKESIQSFIKEGGVIYAEGSSLAYLFSLISNSKGENFPMLGVIKGSAKFLNLEPEADSQIFVAREALPNFLLNGGENMGGIRPSRWAYRIEEQIQFAFKVLTPEQLKASEAELEENPPIADGFMPRQNVLGTAFQFNWATNSVVAERLVKFSLTGNK